MIGYPMDSFLQYEDDGTPIYDRAVTSAELRKLYRTLYSNGVLPDAPASEQLLVSAGEGMTVIVNAGFCIVNGLLKWQEQEKTLTFQASQDQDRIDRVVMRFNDADDVRECGLYVLKGTKANNPTPPSLTRNETIYELGLADVYIPSNSYQITQDKITDTRLDPTLCGIISPLGEFDTAQLYNQIQADLNFFRTNKEGEINNWFENQQEAFIGWTEEEQALFIAWFDRMKGQLSEDAAGRLQMEIDDLDSRKIESHIGQIIMSTALDTEDKVIGVYGGTSWEKIEGRFLIGASEDYPVNSEGGSADSIIPEHSHTVDISHGHTASTNAVYPNGGLITGQTNTSSSFGGRRPDATVTVNSYSGSKTSNTVGQDPAGANIPPYKSVYIWERLS